MAVFDDRIEIENPGILLPGLTMDDMRDGVSRVRNRVVARVFKELGLVEQWGTWVRRMIAACDVIRTCGGVGGGESRGSSLSRFDVKGGSGR